ncbi:MAG: tRNA (adenosine(37)-N6)-dimethylallyltransferase MiaA [Coleofasciculaceae cyanobacterium SM2_1_6]|nr:tRNA (adenosine(37)-N6)-dimethylallyltransferase MiaA [Coleofasciculaceae cyanobacterium SM2_1_6]
MILRGKSSEESSKESRGKLIVICGATATGKSGLALALAGRFPTVILSADSRQVYREFDIGTAKPSLSDRSQILHHLIDICDPQATLTVADYQAQAQELISHYHQQGITPLLVGGTGLYIKAITHGMNIPRVAPQPELRSQLATIPQSQLYQMLSQVDPPAATKIHPHDPGRTLRALEVFYVTGVPISAQQGENPPSYPILAIGLDSDWQTLETRIQQRTHQMLEMGWLKEMEYLIKKYGQNLPLLNTLGYAEMGRYLSGETDLDTAIQQTILHTRQFAKRQKTWFHSHPEINWFHVEESNFSEKIWLKIENFLT